MTSTAIPISTQLPCGPDRLKFLPQHLSVTGVYDNGSSHNVHVIENDDLGYVLRRGQKDHRGVHVPYDNATRDWSSCRSALTRTTTRSTTRAVHEPMVRRS